MRRFAVLLAGLGACSTSWVRDAPEDPAVLAKMLEEDDPSRREEAAQRLVRAGWSVEEVRSGDRGSALPSLLDEGAVRWHLERALGESDPEHLVWRAWHAIRRGTLGRNWSRVEESLARQGFQFRERYEPDVRAHSRYDRYLAKSGAYVNGAGDKHDLFFWIHASQEDGKGPWVVRDVFVGLHATFESTFKALAEGERYPRGSLLARFFERPEVAKLADTFPILEEIELTYGRIWDKESEAAAAGFHLNAGFAMKAQGKSGGRGIYFTAESGLDPRETRGGRLVRNGFSRSDAIGPLLPRGSSFWGAGGLKPSGD